MEKRGVELVAITPRHGGQYLGQLGKEQMSIASRKQHLAALRHFFDGMATPHAILLNPALSVRGERYQAVEGKTPEITVKGARALLASIRCVSPDRSPRSRRHRHPYIHGSSRRSRGDSSPGQFVRFGRPMDAALR